MSILLNIKQYHKFVVFLHILHLISSFNDGIDVIYDGSLTGKVWETYNLVLFQHFLQSVEKYDVILYDDLM